LMCLLLPLKGEVRWSCSWSCIRVTLSCRCRDMWRC